MASTYHSKSCKTVIFILQEKTNTADRIAGDQRSCILIFIANRSTITAAIDRVELRKIPMTITLNEEQSVAGDRIASVLRTGGRVTLNGQGGSGKSTTVFQTIAPLISDGARVLLTAPTNKAVRVLEKMAIQQGANTTNVGFATTHGACGLALLPNEETHAVLQVGAGLLREYDVFVGDECSFLGRKMCFDYLYPGLDKLRMPSLFMGDSFQLPPPLESMSPTFDGHEMLWLRGNERQKGDNPVARMNQYLRQAIEYDKPFRFTGEAIDGNGINLVKDAQFRDFIVEQFESDDPDILDQQRALAWTNRRVDNINAAVRTRKFGKGAPPFVVGERVVTGSPFKRGTEVVLSTDEECIVHHVDTEAKVFCPSSRIEYRAVRLVLKPLYAPVDQVILHVLHEADQEDFSLSLKRLAAEARDKRDRKLWAKFWAAKELFADIRHCYAITVHRSQGSTFDRVFMDVKDALKNTKRPERQRLLYVGTSRPRHQLHLNKSPFLA